jgi:hypothetical protein
MAAEKVYLSESNEGIGNNLEMNFSTHTTILRTPFKRIGHVIGGSF